MKSRSIYRSRANHLASSTEAQARRGSWILAALYPSSSSAKAVARNVSTAARLPFYEPAGAYEAYAATHDDGYALWVRYVAGAEPVPELPDAMTVRVCNRGEGPGYSGVGIVTVTVAARCPRCGGPRGVDTVKAYRFAEDGDWYTVDRWTNPCGHDDAYAAVLKESRERPLPPPVGELAVATTPEPLEPPAKGSPAGVILAAAEGWRGMRARAAVQLLDRHGFAQEADRVSAMLRASKSRGHMSARQVAHWLHTGGAT